MIQKIKNILLAVSSAAILGLSMLPATAMAATCATSAGMNQQNCINSNLCQGSNFDLSGKGNTAGTVDNCNASTSTLGDKIKTILNLLSALIGIIAVIMIIYAGFRYVTSAGSEGGVKAAKNAIIYAIIGLVVVALAQVIVHFVITNAVS